MTQLLELAAEDELGFWEASQEAGALVPDASRARTEVMQVLWALASGGLIIVYRYNERGASTALSVEEMRRVINDPASYERPSQAYGGPWFTATDAGAAADITRRGGAGNPAAQ
jgi:hypothetical protein